MSHLTSSGEPILVGPDSERSTEGVSGRPLYFAVSPLKLVLMSICTMGLYELYWFYKNWVLIKERERTGIMPFWRAVFAYFFCYSLFKSVQASAEAVSPHTSISPGPLAAGWIVVTLLWKLPDPFWLVTYLAVLVLLPVQKVVSGINESVAPDHNKNERFTSWNIVALVVGGLFFALIVLGTFLPEE